MSEIIEEDDVSEILEEDDVSEIIERTHLVSSTRVRLAYNR